jgi:hypothetical protein
VRAFYAGHHEPGTRNHGPLAMNQELETKDSPVHVVDCIRTFYGSPPV